jgi:predicted dinucleotide-binding enzyme
MNKSDTKLVAAHTTSGAEQLALKLSRSKVVSAFNTVPSEVLFSVYESRRKLKRPSLVYSGDDADANAVAVSGPTHR